jgi:hypothetical protein
VNFAAIFWRHRRSRAVRKTNTPLSLRVGTHTTAQLLQVLAIAHYERAFEFFDLEREIQKFSSRKKICT